MSSVSNIVEREHEQTGAQSEVPNSEFRGEVASSLETYSSLPILPLPEIPLGSLDMSSILGSQRSMADGNQWQFHRQETVQKRASNVLKLSQENEKLKAELKAMSDRLEAAERRREELAKKQQTIMEAPSS